MNALFDGWRRDDSPKHPPITQSQISKWLRMASPPGLRSEQKKNRDNNEIMVNSVPISNKHGSLANSIVIDTDEEDSISQRSGIPIANSRRSAKK